MYKAAVITISDTCYSGENTDKGGPLVSEILEENNFKVVKKVTVPDDKEMIKKTLCEISDNNEAHLVITTGGTGFSKRDITPEATTEVIEKFVPGISEIMRVKGYEETPMAILSRGVSGIRKESLIINLPGGLKAIRSGLNVIMPALAHGVGTMIGDKELKAH